MDTTKLDEIPLSFKLLAKEELQKELNKYNPYPALDPDKIYVNVVRDTMISETLTETLLKKSIEEENLLSDPLARLYFNPTDVHVENQMIGLHITDVRKRIDHLSAELVRTYRKLADDFWKSEEISIP